MFALEQAWAQDRARPRQWVEERQRQRPDLAPIHNRLRCRQLLRAELHALHQASMISMPLSHPSEEVLHPPPTLELRVRPRLHTLRPFNRLLHLHSANLPLQLHRLHVPPLLMWMTSTL